ncbi:hypothetical protein SAMN06265795_105219 [Noviherbaspirillum humi]|uniref:Atrophin-1 multi-domain protein n=1 Tax=Noviherbaspirillum humi TaxID=1688639 RepID=A0A239GVY6_9BURK|nr:Atrophin-1 multi-domain protein [Noviherbaspirillum humi]SNS73277.1 hypothetical protein SAMN06265795_105219 [Noviherbaspirillum humi]
MGRDEPAGKRPPARQEAQIQAWGSASKPFAADSPWNSRPVDPVLDDNVGVPAAKYSPAVMASKWSTRVFVSRADDGSMTVSGPGGKGLWNPDAQEAGNVKIPHWPAGVQGAAGTDGHADIVDPVLGIVHSFWQLRQEEGRWTAAQYAWSPLAGRGWGDPAHYFQGARATGVPAMAGLIRQHEVDDGAPLYRHALALSLATNALAPDPAYIYPATSADREARSVNTGRIPQGALLMLPRGFDVRALADRRVRKIAETLKTYGAYVVDRNDGTPFIVYAETGSGLDLPGEPWNKEAAADLEKIREALRQVTGAQAWLDGDGRRIVPDKDLNLLSLRGPWQHDGDGPHGWFDTWTQSVHFPAAPRPIVQKKDLQASLTDVRWAAPRAGVRYRLKAVSTGGARLRLTIDAAGEGKPRIDSGELGNGESFSFVWPGQAAAPRLYVISGAGKPSSVRGELRRQSDGDPAQAKR